jgi:hypothetical protein
MSDAEPLSIDPPEPNGPRGARRSGFKVTSKGALYLEFTTHRVFAIRPLPARCWTSSLGTPAKWASVFEPNFQLGARIREVRAEDAGHHTEMREYRVRRRQNVRRLLELIPRALQDEVANGWKCGSWALYRFLVSTPSATDLCASEEGARIAFMLAHAHLFVPPERSGRSLAMARRLVRRKRREILGAFGFPSTNASVNVLSKIPRTELNPMTLQALRVTLTDEATRKRAAHASSLSLGSLALLTPTLSPFVDVALLDEVEAIVGWPENVDPTQYARLLEDTVRLSQGLQMRVPVIRGIGELVMHHDALTLKARAHLILDDAPLPVLPLPLTDRDRSWLRPLRTLHALVAEGELMHHCLGTLDWQRDAATRGDLVCFAVDGDERLTLALMRHDGAWRVQELRGFANSPPSQRSLERARDVASRWNVGIGGGYQASLFDQCPF